MLSSYRAAPVPILRGERVWETMMVEEREDMLRLAGGGEDI